MEARDNARSSSWVPSPQISERVATYVRDLILQGTLRESMYVRVEQLANQLDISPTPVREAMAKLRGEGFLELEPRRGYVVQPLNPRDVEDMWEAQALIAGELAARAAMSMDSETFARLAEIHADFETTMASGDGPRLEQLDFDFHRLINRCNDSPKLIWLLGLIIKYVPRGHYSEIEGWDAETFDEHAAIISALRRDPELARHEMIHHVKRTSDVVVARMRSTWLVSESDASEQPD